LARLGQAARKCEGVPPFNIHVQVIFTPAGTVREATVDAPRAAVLSKAAPCIADSAHRERPDRRIVIA
jgi:hypothetical protein